MIVQGRVRCKCASDNIEYYLVEGDLGNLLECRDCNYQWRMSRQERFLIEKLLQLKAREEKDATQREQTREGGDEQ